MKVCPRCRDVKDQGRFAASGGVCRDCYERVLAGIARFRRKEKRAGRGRSGAAVRRAPHGASLSHSRLIPPGGFGLDHCPFAAGEIVIPGMTDVPEEMIPALICPLG